MYILDTNTLVYFFKGAGNVAQNLFAVSPQDVGLPTIVIYELQYGLLRLSDPRKRQAQFNDFLQTVKQLAFGINEAKTAAEIRVYLEHKGTPIGPHDVLIAATALADNHTLVTHNTKEFQRIDKLKLTDWY
jgi:tRNA(fMet)-specific endonuclease VapC